MLDEDAAIAEVLAGVEALDAEAVVASIDDAAVEQAYQADRAAARTAAGGPTEAQGRAANSDGAVRFTAPSVVFETEDGRRLEAGGFQPLEAYDVCLANLDPALDRRPPATDVTELLAEFPYGITTREVALCMAERLDPPDDDGRRGRAHRGSRRQPRRAPRDRQRRAVASGRPRGGRMIARRAS